MASTPKRPVVVEMKRKIARYRRILELYDRITRNIAEFERRSAALRRQIDSTTADARRVSRVRQSIKKMGKKKPLASTVR